MNDAIRPVLYGAFHEIRSVREPKPTGARQVADVVGPVCESGDFFAKDRELPMVAAEDLLVR